MIRTSDNMQMAKLCTVEAAQFQRYYPISVYFFDSYLKIMQSFHNLKTSLKQPRLMIELNFSWPRDGARCIFHIKSSHGLHKTRKELFKQWEQPTNWVKRKKKETAQNIRSQKE